MFLSPSLSFPHTQTYTHWHTFFKCSLLNAPNDIPSVSECWALFVQWTQWLRMRSKHYYHIITGVIRALFGAHVALRGLGSVLDRHSFSDRAFIYLQYIVPSFPYASPPLRRPLEAPCWCQYSRENEVQWWARGKARKRNNRSQTDSTSVALVLLRGAIQSRQKNIKLKCRILTEENLNAFRLVWSIMYICSCRLKQISVIGQFFKSGLEHNVLTWTIQ